MLYLDTINSYFLTSENGQAYIVDIDNSHTIRLVKDFNRSIKVFCFFRILKII